MSLIPQTLVFTVTTATAALVNLPVGAFTVTPTTDTNALLNTLLGNTTGLSNFQISLKGDTSAFGLVSNTPFEIDSGIVLSTGRVEDLPGENTSSGFGNDPDLSTDLEQPGNDPDSYDLAQLDIIFDADSTVNKLFFQYVFGSEEFLEYGGSPYNDSFELLLNGTNLAKLSTQEVVSINNLVPNLDNPPYHPDYINNPAAPGTLTKLDGYTKVLTFEGLLHKNAQNILSVRIKDVTDGTIDSAIIIKADSFGTNDSQQSEALPEPTVSIGILGLGACGFILSVKRQMKPKN